MTIVSATIAVNLVISAETAPINVEVANDPMIEDVSTVVNQVTLAENVRKENDVSIAVNSVMSVINAPIHPIKEVVELVIIVDKQDISVVTVPKIPIVIKDSSVSTAMELDTNPMTAQNLIVDVDKLFFQVKIS